MAALGLETALDVSHVSLEDHVMPSHRLSAAGVLIGGGRRLMSWLKTSSARRSAVMGRKAVVTSTGEVVNIAGVRERIVVGDHVVIAGELLIFAHAGEIKIGNWVFIGQGSRLWSSSGIEIGSRVQISHNVEIHDTESHPIDAEARAAQLRHIFEAGHPKQIDGIRARPIKIGDDVWIGFGATIRKGVTIGPRSIIGARAIVIADVPADTIVRVPPSPVVYNSQESNS